MLKSAWKIRPSKYGGIILCLVLTLVVFESPLYSQQQSAAIEILRAVAPGTIPEFGDTVRGTVTIGSVSYNFRFRDTDQFTEKRIPNSVQLLELDVVGMEKLRRVPPGQRQRRLPFNKRYLVLLDDSLSHVRGWALLHDDVQSCTLVTAEVAHGYEQDGEQLRLTYHTQRQIGETNALLSSDWLAVYTIPDLRLKLKVPTEERIQAPYKTEVYCVRSVKTDTGEGGLARFSVSGDGGNASNAVVLDEEASRMGAMSVLSAIEREEQLIQIVKEMTPPKRKLTLEVVDPSHLAIPDVKIMGMVDLWQDIVWIPESRRVVARTNGEGVFAVETNGNVFLILSKSGFEEFVLERFYEDISDEPILVELKKEESLNLMKIFFRGNFNRDGAAYVMGIALTDVRHGNDVFPRLLEKKAVSEIESAEVWIEIEPTEPEPKRSQTNREARVKKDASVHIEGRKGWTLRAFEGEHVSWSSAVGIDNFRPSKAPRTGYSRELDFPLEDFPRAIYLRHEEQNLYGLIEAISPQLKFGPKPDDNRLTAEILVELPGLVSPEEVGPTVDDGMNVLADKELGVIDNSVEASDSPIGLDSLLEPERVVLYVKLVALCGACILAVVVFYQRIRTRK